MLRGSINHVSLCVADLDEAMRFFGPLLSFLGYEVGEAATYREHRLTVNINASNRTALNVWQTEPGLADQHFDIYAPGLHHLCWNLASRSEVDALAALLPEIGGEILDGPGEFPFAEDGYYAVYFLGPHGMKFEAVYMPELEAVYTPAFSR